MKFSYESTLAVNGREESHTRTVGPIPTTKTISTEDGSTEPYYHEAMQPTSHDVYNQRINVVIDHINEHLNQSHCIDELAKVGHFSKFHFHRVFKNVGGGAVLSFVKRLRLERALKLIPLDDGRTLTQIARWRVEYNTIRPHSSLGYRTPAPETRQPHTNLKAGTSIGGRSIGQEFRKEWRPM